MHLATSDIEPAIRAGSACAQWSSMRTLCVAAMEHARAVRKCEVRVDPSRFTFASTMASSCATRRHEETRQKVEHFAALPRDDTPISCFLAPVDETAPTRRSDAMVASMGVACCRDEEDRNHRCPTTCDARIARLLSFLARAMVDIDVCRLSKR